MRAIAVFSRRNRALCISFLDHLQFTQAEKDEHYRAFLNQLASEHGANVLKQLLDSVDAEAAEKIHVNKDKKIDSSAGDL